MREILFRGKRLDNGEWVEGAVLDDRGGAFYICPAVSDITYGDNGNRRRIGCWYKVDPATVGQYTGLTDKNGKKVFENDIIVICYETDGEEFSETKKVRYNEKKCCWYPMRWEEYCEHCDHYTEVKSIEVIGNIHDNQELLKGGADERR